MEGRCDWGRYDIGTFRRRDVLTMGRFDCKAIAVAVVINNWPRPLTPQSIMPSLNHCDLLRHAGVNNLPKVVILHSTAAGN